MARNRKATPGPATPAAGAPKTRPGKPATETAQLNLELRKRAKRLRSDPTAPAALGDNPAARYEQAGGSKRRAKKARKAGGLSRSLAHPNWKEETTPKALYFAYGSNLNAGQMQQRCPDAVPVCPIHIPGWRLVFRGVADIEKAEPAERVVGYLWRISKRDERALDRYEGFPHLYDKRYFKVRPNGSGKTELGMFYLMTDQSTRSAPSSYYFRSIAEGYRDFDLPKDALHEALSISVDEELSKPVCGVQFDKHCRAPKPNPGSDYEGVRAPAIDLPAARFYICGVCESKSCASCSTYARVRVSKGRTSRVRVCMNCTRQE